jgi:hypothetical protein
VTPPCPFTTAGGHSRMVLLCAHALRSRTEQAVILGIDLPIPSEVVTLHRAQWGPTIGLGRVRPRGQPAATACGWPIALSIVVAESPGLALVISLFGATLPGSIRAMAHTTDVLCRRGCCEPQQQQLHMVENPVDAALAQWALLVDWLAKRLQTWSAALADGTTATSAATSSSHTPEPSKGAKLPVYSPQSLQLPCAPRPRPLGRRQGGSALLDVCPASP